MRCGQSATSFPERLYIQLTQDNGRPEETYIEEKEARAQHSQDGSGDRDPEVPALPEHEAAAPRLRRVRVLRW
jgi:hypothetical protein